MTDWAKIAINCQGKPWQTVFQVENKWVPATKIQINTAAEHFTFSKMEIVVELSILADNPIILNGDLVPRSAEDRRIFEALTGQTLPGDAIPMRLEWRQGWCSGVYVNDQLVRYVTEFSAVIDPQEDTTWVRIAGYVPADWAAPTDAELPLYTAVGRLVGKLP